MKQIACHIINKELKRGEISLLDELLKIYDVTFNEYIKYYPDDGLAYVADKFKDRELFPERTKELKGMIIKLKDGGDSGYIGEELLIGRDRLKDKCECVDACARDQDFTLEEALQAYQVTREEYLKYLRDKMIDEQETKNIL